MASGEKEAKRKSFSNTTVRELTPGKPHIALIDGFWRVSPWKRRTSFLYYQAHAFIDKLNCRKRRIYFKASEE